MILLPHRLADALNRDHVSDADKLRYLMLVSALGVLSGARAGSPAGGWSGDRLWFAGIGLLITLSGLYSCFAVNRRGDGRAFLERYICLSAPLSVAVYALFFFLYWAGWQLSAATGHGTPADAEWYSRRMSLVISMVTLIAYYQWLRALFRRASVVLAA